jgi:hypothetical protein
MGLGVNNEPVVHRNIVQQGFVRLYILRRDFLQQINTAVLYDPRIDPASQIGKVADSAFMRRFSATE